MNRAWFYGFIFFLGSVCSVLFAQARVITLEGDVINGTVTSISNHGIVRVGGKELPLDGLRSIVPLGDFNQIDESEGRVVLICGTEFAVTKVSLFEEMFTLSVQDLGDIKVPIDSVRALRF